MKIDVPSHLSAAQIEEFWSTALGEFESPRRRPGLWAKAFTEAQGNEAVAKASYLQGRVDEMIGNENARAEKVLRTRLAYEQSNRVAAFNELKKQTVICPVCERTVSKTDSFCPFCKYDLRENPHAPADGIDAESVFFLRHYREMDTEELVKLRSVELTEVAAATLQRVLSERGVSAGQKNLLETPAKAASGVGPSGIGGWLALLIAGLIVIGPLLGAGRLLGEFSSAERQYPALLLESDWSSFKSAIWWVFAVAAAISAYAGIGLVRSRNSRAVVQAQAALWIAGPLTAVVMNLVVPVFIFGSSNPESAFFGRLLGSVITAAIWTAYLSKSKRVQATYGTAQT